MSSFRIRPRFKHLIDATQEDLEQKIGEALEQEDEFIHTYLPGHIYIKIHPKSQHIWSPQLHLTFEKSDKQVIVRGLYGPNPTIWAFFFFGYVATGILSLFIGMWGLSLYTLGNDASILWVIPGLSLVALVLYLVSQTGQKLGAQQMFDIHHFYEELVRDKIIVH